MPNERDSYSALKFRDLSIGGNELRVGVDADGDIVFVLDLAVNETKPNVLLVIDSDDGRKWDDILGNDYGVDLEDVRPKKDNKYQKLDIEYDGLDVYRGLIAAYDADEDMGDELAQLARFRNAVVRRAATARLATAEGVIDNTRETIEKTNDSIDELDERVRVLRGKLSDLRKNIGKEPTKQSAAKILRVESQIDATNEKIKRAKKRLDNAQKRLMIATDDADAARDILGRVEMIADDADLPAVVVDKPIAVRNNDDKTNLIPVTDDDDTDDDEYETTFNTKAENMADEDVKPLFDTDPEILDDEIAFKPIDFSVPAVDTTVPPAVPVEPSVPETVPLAPLPSAPQNIEPLSFEAPVASEYVPETDGTLLPSQMETPAPAPVLDSITSVETPTGMDISETQTEFIPEPVVPEYATQMPATHAPATDVAPAPVDSGFRPVSPISGVAPVTATNAAPKAKQSVVYYVLLVALILLSIFVLWFYQKSTGGGALPSIGDKVAPEIVEPVIKDAEPTIIQEPVVKETVAVDTPVVKEPVPVVDDTPGIEQKATEEPVLQDEAEEATPSLADTLPEPVIEAEMPVQEIQAVEAEMPQPVKEEVPAVVEMPAEQVIPMPVSILKTVPDAPEPAVVKVVETEEEVLAKKPAYGVSQNDAMFMAADNFETDRLSPETESDFVMVDMYDTPIVSTPQPEYVDETGACENGAAPDKFGCCPGETYTQIDNGGFVCCPDTGGDCFPPLF